MDPAAICRKHVGKRDILNYTVSIQSTKSRLLATLQVKWPGFFNTHTQKKCKEKKGMEVTLEIKRDLKDVSKSFLNVKMKLVSMDTHLGTKAKK